MSFFTVDIYTPSQTMAKNVAADALIIPTCRGEINVLPEHTHVVSQLETGVLTIESGNKKEHFVVTAGICKVLKNKVTILALTSERSDQIDRERAQKALEKAKMKLSGKETLTEWDLTKYRRKLDRAEVRLRVALMRK